MLPQEESDELTPKVHRLYLPVCREKLVLRMFSDGLVV